MKVELLVRVVAEVDDSDGYPEEFNRLSANPRDKRERQILTAFHRAVRSVQDDVVELLNIHGYDAELIKKGTLM
jgi:ankyrin repeat protein